jgi:8-oxo-dGTP diphosphatase
MSETDWLNEVNPQTFGEKIEGLHYLTRKTAYAVIFDEKLGFASVKTRSGKHFLLGGGIEGDETEEECIKREILEEIGYEASVDRWIGRAGQYFVSTNTQQAVFNEASFYIAKLHKKIQEPIEEDHQLIWIKTDLVDKMLFHEHQRWAVKKSFKSLF